MVLCSEERWLRAARYLPDTVLSGLCNHVIEPRWLGDSAEFLYRRQGQDAPEFRIFNAATGNFRAAIDQDQPRVSSICDGETLSPDGKLAAFCRDHNIWLRDTSSGISWPLTTDGVEGFAWGKSPDINLSTITNRRHGIILPAAVTWAPDSSQLFTYHLDERAVAKLPLVQHVPDDGSARPILHELRFAFSGEEGLPLAHFAIIDVQSNKITKCLSQASIVGMMSAIEASEAWWSHNSERVYFLNKNRDTSQIELCEVDAATGIVRIVLSETGESFVETNVNFAGIPCVRILSRSDEVVWFSPRDGWGHLYLFDLQTSRLKRQITSGEWLVTDIIAIDERERRVYFQAGGMDNEHPYYRRICSESLDGTDLRIISAEDGDNSAPFLRLRLPRNTKAITPGGSAMSRDNRHIVYSNAAIDRLPVTIVRDLQTSKRWVVETASYISPDGAAPAPRHIRVKATDDLTDLFGTMWLPSDFDPGKKYPTLNFIYPGPQRGQSPRTLYPDDPNEFFYAMLGQAFAELGIIVYCIEARGTPGRSKPFHDHCYKRLGDPTNLDDQVYGLRQMAREFSFIDLSRSGIMGHSSGGNATARAMFLHPDVYHVGISTAGNHDQRGYAFNWTEKYNGCVETYPDGTTNYDRTANSRLATKLRGKLFLATGDMDDNVHPCLTMQVVSALVSAGKDFELLVMPNEDHGSLWRKDYFLRRAMGFLAQHLVGGEEADAA
ncbi:hypothetical protein ASD00_31090 [Ensifer sp. Root31]|uniref:S9 family peptidase n=1 Tax=Ensifer sp. Root31 TaxID=1736512 RepID=UPI00070D2C08|nr:DPP IV N-terminal domain-containing protein [Ensifer sp. Root31]KQU86343.1 hypothetical protein ASD00_31090 [Ensifer sp. Root31]